MIFPPRRSRPRHAAARTAAELAQPAGQHAAQDDPAGPGTDHGQGYDAAGWADGAPLPRGDETMLFRVPGIDGGPGFIIPPATLRTADPEPEPEDALPHRRPGAGIPPAAVPVLRTEPADPGLLRDVRDALKALPDGPQRDSGEDKPPAVVRHRPTVWLRVIEHDGLQANETLSGTPEFAGNDTLPDGTAIAGMFLGIHGQATWLVDTVDPAWCDDAITALTAMRDQLTAAREQAAGGAAA